jgi:hypothetical protein
MSEYRDKINRQKQGGLYRVSDFYINGDAQAVREYTHEIAFLQQDVVKFDREIDILHFTDTAKQLQVNVTNGDLLMDAFGDDPDLWPGSKVTLFLSPYGKEGKLGIRVRKAGTEAPMNARTQTPASTPLPALIGNPPFDDEVPF